MKFPSRKEKSMSIMKKGKKALVAGICTTAVVGVGALAIWSFASKKTNADILPVMDVKVEQGQISTSIESTGALSNGEAVEMDIPTGVTIDEVKVVSGDTVKPGDILATVNQASLNTALLSTQEAITSLDSQINEESTDSETRKVTAAVSGRVKNISVAKGDLVSSAMLEQGALMLISLDGKMKVELETTQAVSVGDDVKVTREDGDVLDGTIANVNGTYCTVTVTDNGTRYQEAVSISDIDGNKLGDGTLAINQELKITETSGTVDSIYVSENEKVSVDKKLLTLSGEFASAEYYSLMEERGNREEELELLLEIAQNHAVAAKTEGVVTQVNVSSGKVNETSTNSQSNSTTTNSTGTNSNQMTGMSHINSTSGGFVTLSAQVAETPAENNEVEVQTQPTTPSDSEETPEPPVEEVRNIVAITKVNPVTIATPITGNTPTSSVDEAGGYTSTITWNQADSTFKESTVYSAVITLTAKEGFRFTGEIAPVVKGAVVSGVTVGGEEEGNSVTFTAVFPKTEKEQSKTPSGEQSTGEQGNSSQPTVTPTPSLTPSGMGSGTGTGSATGAGSGATGTGSLGGTTIPTTDTSTTQYTTGTSDNANSRLVTAFGIAPADSMLVTVNVDELDVLSVLEGQKATLTFDAIANKTFEGEITNIDKNGSSSSGVTKYAVEITVAKNDSMLSGMNASVAIILEEKSDILVIPSAAVQERGNRSFVYTEKDKETGELSGETEVETGVTDGSSVEITSGLRDGETVYYQTPVTSSNENTTGMMRPQGGMGGMMQARPEGTESTGSSQRQGAPMGGGGQ